MFDVRRFYDLRRVAQALIFWAVPLAVATGVLLGAVHADSVVVSVVIVLFVVAVTPPILVFSFKRSDADGSSPLARRA